MQFKNYLSQVINSNTLPGFEAQKLMAPASRHESIKSFTQSGINKKSSVLALINTHFNSETESLSTNQYNNPSNNLSNNLSNITKYSVLLTQRSSKLKSHTGQISFPGGRQDENETDLETAVREMFEEVGVSSNNYEIVGQLSPLVAPPSNSIITPFVAFYNTEVSNDKIIQDLIISQDEVDKAFFVELDFLSNVNNLKIENWDLMGKKLDVPFWDISRVADTQTPLWGATAIILSELIEIYKNYYKSLNSL